VGHGVVSPGRRRTSGSGLGSSCVVLQPLGGALEELCTTSLVSTLQLTRLLVLTCSDDDFGNDDALVACRQLGFAYGIAVTQLDSTYRLGPGTGPILLDNLHCDPAVHTRIEECPSNGWGVHNCGHGEDVGVSCRQTAPGALPPAPGNRDAPWAPRMPCHCACSDCSPQPCT
jgi:hypothetical protein